MLVNVRDNECMGLHHQELWTSKVVSDPATEWYHHMERSDTHLTSLDVYARLRNAYDIPSH